MNRASSTIALVCFANVMTSAQAPPAAAGPLTNSDVTRLLALGVSDRTVLAVIQEAKDRQFDRSADATSRLKAAGVSEPVIAAIQRTAPSAVPEGAGVDRQKFEKLDDAGKALGSAITGTGASLGQIDRLLQTFKAEVAAARDRTSTPAERSLVTAYALALLHFDTGLSQMNAPQRAEAWAKGSAALEEARRMYAGK